MGLLFCAIPVLAQEPRATFNLENTNVKQALDVIRTYFGTKIGLSEEYEKRAITLKTQNETIEQVLEKVAKELGAKLRRDCGDEPLDERLPFLRIQSFDKGWNELVHQLVEIVAAHMFETGAFGRRQVTPGYA